jgi:periplasmic copper chaperone A
MGIADEGRKPMRQHRTTLRTAARAALGTLAAGCAACLVLVAAPGWAHVTVNPSTAAQGGYTVLSFRVPTESDSASTTKVQVFLPADHPLASVSVRPHPGWHTKVVTKKLATPLSTDDGQVTEGVYSITWTPDGPKDALKPGEYDDFDVSVGPLPEVSSLTFKTLQTYSDGTVVRWIDPPAASGQPEPEHPAPTLTLTPASDTSSGDPMSSDAATASGPGDGKATTALVLSIVAVLLGAGALVSTLRRRSAR